MKWAFLGPLSTSLFSSVIWPGATATHDGFFDDASRTYTKIAGVGYSNSTIKTGIIVVHLYRLL